MNDKTLSCTMSGMGSSAAIKWIDPDNVDVPTNDADNYVVDDGISGFNPTGGTQTTQLTIKAQKLRTLNSAGTWKCSVTPSQYAGSPASQGTVTVTPIGKCFLCISTPCVDGRILVAFLYVASRRNYLRHFIAASRTQF